MGIFVNPGNGAFQVAVNFANKDDVLTYLIHLGYQGIVCFAGRDTGYGCRNRGRADRKDSYGFCFYSKARIYTGLSCHGGGIKMESKCKNSNAADKRKTLSGFSEVLCRRNLLVAINYDKKTKVHQCLIEKYEKER